MEQWQGQAAIIAALGYFGQWLKSIKAFPTWAAQACIAISAVAAFALLKVPEAGHASEWLRDAVGFAVMALGVSSLSAGMGLAPKTDSKP